MAASSAALAMCAPAWAGPEGETVVSGSASFVRDGANTAITAANNTIINYQSFDIARHESVRFVQPDAASRVFNNITGSNFTQIAGTLTSNGIVYIMNPAGVYFREGAVVNVGGIYAGAAHLSDADFLQGHNNFTDMSGAVVNEGTINAQTVALIGREVANRGVINSPGGTVVMASGDSVYMGERGGRIFVQVATTGAPAVAGTGVEQSGTINARGGRVAIAAGDLYSMAIRHTGATRARDIAIEGSGRGNVQISGAIDATGSGGADQARGGQVRITGERVGVMGASIDASGAAGGGGGGSIAIGGEYQGGGTLGHATSTVVMSDSVIRSDGTGAAADGGEVVIWSDVFTGFYGRAYATGTGRGGSIETSSAGALDIRGADVSAAGGTGAGQWLLDPRNITIVASGGIDPATLNPFESANAGEASINVTAIETALEGGTDVEIRTFALDGATEAGNITWNAALAVDIAAATTRVLTLKAANNIIISAGASIDATAGGAANGKLDINLFANDGSGSGPTQDVTTTIGTVTVNAALRSNGGIITLGKTAGNRSSGVTVNTGGVLDSRIGTAAAGGGAINLQAAGPTGIAVNEVINTGGGALSIIGTGTANVVLAQNAVITAGAMTINTVTSNSRLVRINGNITADSLSVVTNRIELNQAVVGGFTITTNAGSQLYSYAATSPAGNGLRLSGNASLVANGATSDITFTSNGTSATVNGAFGLTVNAGRDVIFSTSVGNTSEASRPSFLDITAAGTIVFNQGLVQTSSATRDDGRQVYTGTVRLAADTEFKSTAGASFGTITFNSALTGTASGVQSLTTTGNAVFNGDLGTAGIRLESIFASQATTFGGANAFTTGDQTYAGAFTLANDGATITGTNVLFNGALNADDATNEDRALSVVASGNTTFNQAVGTTQALFSLTTDAPGQSSFKSVTTEAGGFQNYGDQTATLNGTYTTNGGNFTIGITTILAGTTVVNAGAGNATFTQGITGAFALTANSGAATLFGSTVNIASLTTSGGGGAGDTTTLRDTVTTSGSQVYNDAVLLGWAVGAAGSRTLSGSALTFSSTVDNENAGGGIGRALVVNSSGAVMIVGDVGGNVATGPLFSLTSDAGGTLSIGNATTQAAGFQLYADDTVTFNSTYITNGGDFSVNDAGAGVADAVLASNTVINTGGGDVLFEGTVNGTALNAQTLSITAGAGDVSFQGAVGNSVPLGDTTIVSADDVSFMGAFSGTGYVQQAGTGLTTFTGLATTTGATGINFTGANLTLNGGAAVSGTGGIASDNAGLLTIGATALNITGTGAFSQTSTAGTGTVALNASTINTNDRNIGFASGTTLATGAVVLNTTGGTTGNITFTAAVAGAQALTATSGGTTTFNSTVGAGTALASLTTDGGGTTILRDAVTTSGAQTYNDAVLLGWAAAADRTLAGSAVSFNAAVDNENAGGRGLTVNTTGGGTTTFAGVVGGGANGALLSLTTNADGTSTLLSVSTTGAQSYADSTVTLNGTYTTTGGAFRVSDAGAGTANAVLAGGTTVNAGAGAITFEGTVTGGQGLTANSSAATLFGSTVNIASLTTSGGGGAGDTTTLRDAVTTSGSQTYNDAVLLGWTAGGANVRTFSGSAVSFNAAVDNENAGGRALTVNAAGATTFAAAVGGGANGALDSLTTDNGGGGTAESTVIGANITTTNALTINDAAVLTGVGVRAISAGSATFASTVRSSTSGQSGLSLTTTTGAAQLQGVVGGGSQALLSLTVNADTTASSIGATTTGAQDYTGTTGVSLSGAYATSNAAFGVNSNATLTGNTTVNTTAGTGGNITFTGTLIGGQTLTATSGGTTTFNSTVGAGVGNALTSLTTDGGGTTILRDDVTTTGSQTYNDAVLLGWAALATRTLSGGAVELAATVNNEDNTGGRGLLVNSAGTTTFGGVVGGDATNGALLSLTTDNGGGGAESTIIAADINTSGDATFNDAVQIGGTVGTARVVTAGNATFAGTVGSAAGGARGLTVNTTEADADQGLTLFSGAVSGLNTLTTNANGTTRLDDAVTTTGAQQYNDALRLGWAVGATRTLSGGSVQFASTVDNVDNTGGRGLAVNSAGATTFAGAVGGGANGALLSLSTDGGGTSSLQSVTTEAAGSQAYADDTVTLSGTYTTNGGGFSVNNAGAGTANAVLGGNTIISTGNGTVLFEGTVNADDAAANDRTLSIVSTGTTTFMSAVGGQTDGELFSLTTDAGGSTSLSDVRTEAGGFQAYSDGTVTLSGTYTTNGGSFSVSDAGAGTANAVLGGTTLVNAGAGAITFEGTVTGGQSLTANSSAATTFGSTVSIGSLTTNNGGGGAGESTILRDAVTTTGSQTYNDAVLLGWAAAADRTLSGSSVSLNGAVDNETAGGRGLTVNTSGAGATTFGGVVGGGANGALLSLTTNADGTTVLNTTAVSTTGALDFGDAVTVGGSNLASGGTLTLNYAGATFRASVASAAGGGGGARNLTVNSSGGGLTDFQGALGTGGSALGAVLSNADGTFSATAGGNTAGLTISDAGATTLGGTFTTTGFSAAGPVTLASATTINAGAGNITFTGTVGGVQSLAANSDGVTRFGSTVNIASLTTDLNAGANNAPTERTELNGDVTVTGGATFNDAVVLTSNAAINAGSSGITFGGAVSGAFALTANSDTLTRFASTVSIASLTTDLNAGANNAPTERTELNGDVTVTAGATFNDAAVLTGNVAINAGASAITFANAVSGAFALTANSSAATLFGSTVNIASLTTSGGGGAGDTTTLRDTVTTSGSQTYNDAVLLGWTAGGANVRTFSGSAGSFNSSVDNENAGGRALTVNSAGVTTFAGTVGGGANGALDSLTTDNGGGGAAESTVIGANITTTNALTINDAAVLTGVGVRAIAAGSATFASTVRSSTSGQSGLSLTTTAGAAQLQGIVGGNAQALLSLTVNASTTAGSIGVTTTGAQDYTGATGVNLSGAYATTNAAFGVNSNATLTGNTTIATSAGNITFTGSLNGTTANTQTLGITAGGGDATFQGAVGNTVALGNATVVSADDVSFQSTLGASGYLQQAGTGTTTFTGLATTTGATGINFTGANLMLNGGAAVSGAGGIAVANAGTLTIAAVAVNITGTGVFNQTGAGSVTLANSTISTNEQNISFTGPVTLTTGTATLSTGAGAAGNITFAGTVVSEDNASRGLTLGGRTGSVSFQAAVGGGATISALGDILIADATTVTASSTIRAANLTQSLSTGAGTSTFSGLITTTGATGISLTGAGFTLNGGTAVSGAGGIAVNNAGALSIGSTAINLTGTGGLSQTSTAGTGTVVLNGSTINTNDRSIAFASNTTLATGAVLLNTTAGTNGNITFTGAVVGGQVLTATSGGTSTFNSTVGAGVGNALASLSTDGGGTTVLGGNVTTTGNQTYGDRVILANTPAGADYVLTANAGSLIAFNANNAGALDNNSSVDGTAANLQGLTINGAAASFAGLVGANTALEFLTLNAGLFIPADTILSLGATPLTLGAVTGPGGGASLTITTSGLTTLGGAFTNITNFTSNGGGETCIAVDLSISGSFLFSEDVCVAGAVGSTRSLTSTGNDQSITFGGRVYSDMGGARGLSLTTASGANSLKVFTGEVGGERTAGDARPLTTLTTNAIGTTRIGGNVTTTGVQNFGDAVEVTGAGTRTFTGTDLTFAGTLRSNADGTTGATLSGTGTTTLGGAVGDNAQRLESLASNGGGTTILRDAVTTTGSQTYADAVLLGWAAAADRTLSGSSVSLNAAVNNENAGGRGLTVDTTGGGITTFGGIVGGGANGALLSLTTNADGTSTLLSVSTTGAQSYADSTVTLNGAYTTAGGAFSVNDAGGGTANTVLAGNTTIITGGGPVMFEGTVNGTNLNGETLGITAGSGDVTFQGAAGDTVALGAVTVVSADDVSFQSTFVASDYVQQAGTGTTTFTGLATTTGAIGINFTGANLTINGGTAVSGTGGIGVANTGTLTVASPAVNITGTGTFNQSGAGGVTLANSTISTNNQAVNFNGPITLTTGATTVTSGAGSITFAGTVSGAQSLTANSDGVTRFNAAVNIASLTTDLNAGANGAPAERTELNGDVTVTGGATFNDAVTLTNSVTIDAGSSDILFGGAVTGAFALTANSDTLTRFASMVNIASLTTDLNAGANNAPTERTELNGDVTVTAGATFNDAAALTSNLTINGGASAITFGSAVSGAFGLTATTSGTTTFNSTVGAGTALASLTTNGGGTTILRDAVTTTTFQTYTDAVRLGWATGAAGSRTFSGSALTFSSTVDNETAGGGIGRALAVSSAGATMFVGDVGGSVATGPLFSLTSDAGGTLSIGNVSTQGAGFQLYADDTVTFNSTYLTNGGDFSVNDTGAGVADAVLASNTIINTSGGNLLFEGTVNGTTADAQTLSITAGAGDVTFQGAVGDTVPLGDTTVVSADDVSFMGAFSGTGYTQQAGTGLTTFTGLATTTGGTGINFTGTNLTINGGVQVGGTGGIAVDNAGLFTVGATALNLTGTGAFIQTSAAGTGTVLLNGSTINTNDRNIGFASNTTLATGAVLLNTTNGSIGNITFTGTVDGGQALTATSGGTTTFNSTVGAGTPLASLTTDGGGTTVLRDAVTTTGAQTYNDAALLGWAAAADRTLTGSAVSFVSTVDNENAGGRALTVNTTGGGATTFGGIVGAVNGPLASLTTNANGTTVLNTTALSVAGAFDFGDALTIGGSNLAAAQTLTLNYNTGTFRSTVESAAGGARNLTLVSSGTGLTSFMGLLGTGANPLGAVMSNADGSFSAVAGGNTGTLTINDAVAITLAGTFNTAGFLGSGPATLTGVTAINAGAGPLTFTGTVDGPFALAANSTGATTFGAAIGATGPLASLTTDAGGTTTLSGNATTTLTQTYNDAVLLAGAVGGTRTLTGTSLAFNATVQSAPGGGRSLVATLTDVAGVATFAGEVGGTDAAGGPLASLRVNGGATTNIGANITIENAAAANSIETIRFGNNVVLTGDSLVNADQGRAFFAGNINSDGTARAFRIVSTASSAAPTMVDLSNLDQLRNFIVPLTFTGNIGNTSPLSFLGLNVGTVGAANIDGTAGIPAISTILFTDPASFNGGGVFDPQAPAHALTHTVNIASGGTFATGQNEKVLATGNLTISTGTAAAFTGTAFVGDVITTGSFTLNSANIRVRTRPPGNVLGITPAGQNTQGQDEGVNFVSGSGINFSSSPVRVTGGFTAPGVFAPMVTTGTTDFAAPDTNTILITGEVPGTVRRRAYFGGGGDQAQFIAEFTDTTTGPPLPTGRFLPLTRRAQGPTDQNVSETITPFTIVDVPQIQPDTSIGQALRAELERIAVNVRGTVPAELVEFLVGRSIFNDKPDTAQVSSTDRQVSEGRLSPEAVQRVVDSYKALEARGDDARALLDEVAAFDTEADFDAATIAEFLLDQPADNDARLLMDQLVELLNDVEQLGLGPIEEAACKERIVAGIRPANWNGNELVQVIEAYDNAKAVRFAPAPAAQPAPGNGAGPTETPLRAEPVAAR
ncbi:MAG: filamentous hemagglutinin N-terminal domain-containing protein [Phycisphaerales bacterium]